MKKKLVLILFIFLAPLSVFSQTSIEIDPTFPQLVHKNSTYGAEGGNIKDSIYRVEGGYISDDQLLSGEYIYVPRRNYDEQSIVSYTGHIEYINCSEGKLVFSTLRKNSISQESDFISMIIDINGESNSCFAIEKKPDAIKEINIKGNQLVGARGYFKF